MDFEHIKVLYDLARDETADPADRSDARDYLRANESEIISAALALPLAFGLKSPHFESYDVVYARNLLDSPWVQDAVTGRMRQDHEAFPPENDRVGNVLLAVARYDRHLAKQAKDYPVSV
jgi:hypothetical protein